jgi:hypothetical protein
VAKLIDGTLVQFDLETGEIKDASGAVIAQCEKLPGFLLEIVRDAGLIPNLKKRFATKVL